MGTVADGIIPRAKPFRRAIQLCPLLLQSFRPSPPSTPPIQSVAKAAHDDSADGAGDGYTENKGGKDHEEERDIPGEPEGTRRERRDPMHLEKGFEKTKTSFRTAYVRCTCAAVTDGRNGRTKRTDECRLQDVRCC